MNLIEERVEMARAGTSPFVISRLALGCLVIADVQPLPDIVFSLLIPSSRA
jgi:hypothetical protein